jgi:flagellar FliL protein
MSTATPTASTVVDAAPPAKGKKKLILIIAAVLVLVLVGGAGALLMMKKAGADTEESAEAEDGAEPAKAVSRRDPKAVPVFVPLDPFTVNLADRNADRYAQVAVTLELADATLEPQLKTYMPAVRNNILLAISDRTAAELMARDGKQALAERIQRETARALGYELPPEPDAAAVVDGAAADDEAPKKKPRRKAAEPALPIRAVLFSNFIIQ